MLIALSRVTRSIRAFSGVDRFARAARALSDNAPRALAFALILLAIAAAPPIRGVVFADSSGLARWVATCPMQPNAIGNVGLRLMRWAPCFSFAGDSAGSLRDLAAWLIEAGAALLWFHFSYIASGACSRWAVAVGPLFVRARARRRAERAEGGRNQKRPSE